VDCNQLAVDIDNELVVVHNWVRVNFCLQPWGAGRVVGMLEMCPWVVVIVGCITVHPDMLAKVLPLCAAVHHEIMGVQFWRMLHHIQRRRCSLPRSRRPRLLDEKPPET
jgi:hypothetical protein